MRQICKLVGWLRKGGGRREEEKRGGRAKYDKAFAIERREES